MPHSVPEEAAGQTSLLRILDEDGSLLDGAALEIPDELLLRIYHAMVLVRAVDTRMLLLQRQGRIGFWGPTTGQEAAVIGSVAALEDRDWIVPALREYGCAVYRGLSLEEIFGQVLGNSLDRTHGRQMPCHFSFKEGNYYSMSSVIGTQTLHAVGVAMAAKLKGDDVVVAGYMGDGATSSTDFHAAMNFAAVRRAPCVLICQNNQWAISTNIAGQMATDTVVIKARAYGMRSVRVDGNDALAVFAATREAAARARAGAGPTFLELLTYRVLGHSSSDDPTRYRDSGEVEAWVKRDPVARLRRFLEGRALWDAGQEVDLSEEIAARLSAALLAAEAAPGVAPESLILDVYSEVPAHLREQWAGATKNHQP
ncbi:MAG: thiamine pyrophosphate-dependent enzyme [Planctomycetota bacterium]